MPLAAVEKAAGKNAYPSPYTRRSQPPQKSEETVAHLIP